MSGEVTSADLKSLERYLDRVWAHLDVDIEFTRHFLDRVNDSRNGKDITVEELRKLFVDAYKKHGGDIARKVNRHKDIGGVLTDLSTNINSPFVLKWDNRNKEIDLVTTTVMRKKNFKPNKAGERKYTVEGRKVLESKTAAFPLKFVEQMLNSQEWKSKDKPKKGNVLEVTIDGKKTSIQVEQNLQEQKYQVDVNGDVESFFKRASSAGLKPKRMNSKFADAEVELNGNSKKVKAFLLRHYDSDLTDDDIEAFEV